MSEQDSQATLSGWRHGPVWTYVVALLASAVALFVSFALSAQTLQLARHPLSKLSCDINATISCTTVAQSWQSEILHFGDLSIPNAFLGIAAESVFVTIAVIGLARVRLPAWFARLTWLGSLLALLYAYWLLSQSLFVIKALCPWCLGLMFSTTIQFMAISHASVSVQGLPKADGPFAGLRSPLNRYYRLHFDLMLDAIWIVALVVLIVVSEGPALFAS
ncbi:membrane protein [Bombiscardovia nodaiensis]|uniref:Membrane protein n=1 Tax=Bombiscardovia nodaiensis TaxID=2932181 RepID=A0ABM8B8W8_9BIFI|nr:membrane protein [Bombiscardovia nodaiensis]